MAILHMQPSEIARLEWDELAYYHHEAIEFYKADKELQLKATAGAVASMFGGGSDVV